MGRWVHRLSNVDLETESAICERCGPITLNSRKTGNPKCAGSQKDAHPYRWAKKDFCEKCGFIPMVVHQLEVDHIDGNHTNNSIDNLQTLCANCHRLKTYKYDVFVSWVPE